ncbi:MAG: hypothetical protein HC915_07190 [Anaerolineae bacterium]|nr:hypothetical protein [Anaerolineae bacterium]
MFDPKQTNPHLWSTAFVPLGDPQRIADVLHEVHTAHGYQPYNPYPGGTGTPSSVNSLVRLFVAPAKAGWTRLIGKPRLELLPEVAQKLETLILYSWISESDGGIIPYGTSSLAAYLRPDKTTSDLRQAMEALSTATGPLLHRPTDSPLQGELAEFAAQQGVDPDQANELVTRTVNTLFKKMGAQQSGLQAEALALVSQQAVSAVSSAPFRRIAAVLDCLTIPPNWHEPGFKELSEVFQIASLLDQDPDAPLLPGDEAILDKVEYPLDYRIAYFSR